MRIYVSIHIKRKDIFCKYIMISLNHMVVTRSLWLTLFKVNSKISNWTEFDEYHYVRWLTTPTCNNSRAKPKHDKTLCGINLSPVYIKIFLVIV